MKRKRLEDVKARRVWTISPESRIKDSDKKYNRNKLKRELRGQVCLQTY